MIGFADPSLEGISLGNHGFEVVGDPFIITRADKDIIFELDGKPAWKRWTERLGLPETSSASDVVVFAPLAIELPPEVHEEYGSRYLVFGALPRPDMSIYGMLVLPEKGKLYLTRRNENKILDGVERLMVQILDRIEGRKPVAVFHADCAARGKLLFNRIIKEEIISKLQYPLCRGEDIPWFGMYGGAEYTPIAGKNCVQTYTTSLYVIVKRKPVFKKEDVQLQPEVVKRSKLFAKTTIRNIKLRNRFIWSATWQGKSNHDGSCSSSHISSMLPVARGETGLIITEMTYVSSNGVCAPGQIGAYDDNLLPGLERMTYFVHRAGSPVVMQLVHGGLFSAPILSGSIPLGPSSLETPDGKIGKEMSKSDIDKTVNAFRNAAVRAKEAGFEGVQ